MNSPVKDLFATIGHSMTAGEDDETLLQRLLEQHSEESAVLVLDSTGFTRATKRFGIIYFLKCIVRMRQIVTDIFTRSDCIDCRVEADNVYAEFKNPQTALDAAISASRAVDGLALSIGDERYFRVCIGIGYGQVFRDEREGVFGDQMNQAAKLGEDIADGGEILLTQAAFDALPPERRSSFQEREMQIAGVRIAFYAQVC